MTYEANAPTREYRSPNVDLIFPRFAARRPQQQPRDGPAADAVRLPDAGLPRPPHILLHRRLRLQTLPLLTLLPVSPIPGSLGLSCVIALFIGRAGCYSW